MRPLLPIAAILAAALPAAPATAQISIGVSIRVAPPMLPVYAQPPIPGPDYIWVPGYWAWDDVADAYFWVPGTWALAPRPGLLWTPAWWGWSDGLYLFHPGYWASHVGFYGGIAYGFGYTGMGYAGGYWRDGHVFYNRTVNNITNVNVTNVYNQTIVNRSTTISYNGGPGGTVARPTPAEQAVMRAPHVAATAAQQHHVAAARANPVSFVTVNHGRPPIPATAHPQRAGGPAAGAMSPRPAPRAVDAEAGGLPRGGRPAAGPQEAGGGGRRDPMAQPARPADAHRAPPMEMRAPMPRPDEGGPPPRHPAPRPRASHAVALRGHAPPPPRAPKPRPEKRERPER